MKKLTLQDILLPGAKLVAWKIDFNDPEIKARIKRVRVEQAKILKRRDHFDRKQLLVPVKTPQLGSFCFYGVMLNLFQHLN